MSEKITYNQEIFNYFAENHNLTLLETEIIDITRVVNEIADTQLTQAKDEVIEFKQVSFNQQGFIDNLEDENTQLKADNEHLENQIKLLSKYILNEHPEKIKDSGACGTAISILKELKAEVARYREALEKIIENGMCPDSCYGCEKCKYNYINIAKQALKVKEV